MAVQTVFRKGWNALPPKQTAPLQLPVQQIIFKYTEGGECRTREECGKLVQDLQKTALDQGMDDIPYNFLMGGDMKVYEGRGWTHRVYENKCVVGYIGQEKGNSEYIEDVMGLGFDFMQAAMLTGHYTQLTRIPINEKLLGNVHNTVI